VACYKYITTAAVGISGSYPDSMSTGTLLPTSRLPGIGVAIPTVISPDPDMLAAWSDGSMLFDGNRRPEPDHHIGRLSTANPDANPQQRSY
jgi:hypothetical protein